MTESRVSLDAPAESRLETVAREEKVAGRTVFDPGVERIGWRFGDGELRLAYTADTPVALVGVDAGDLAAEGSWPESRLVHAAPLVELSIDAEGRKGTSPNAQHRRYLASSRLRYVRHEETAEDGVSALVVVQRDAESDLEVTSRFEHRDGAVAFGLITARLAGRPLQDAHAH